MFKKYASIDEANEAMCRFTRAHVTEDRDTLQVAASNVMLHGGDVPLHDDFSVFS